jgi:hypothetical protein
VGNAFYPSPIKGEGWGEGEESHAVPLPFIPSRQGRGALWRYFLGNMAEGLRLPGRGNCDTNGASSFLLPYYVKKGEIA